MNIKTTVTMTLALAVSGQAAGTIRVCVNSSALGTPASVLALARARTLSSQMFATAGVALEWRSTGAAACRGSQPVRIVVLDFVTNMPPNQHPQAMAYALPYEAVHVVVLFDRIEQNVRSATGVSALLAHVMTHEITHILQGTARHSETGVMKAYWDIHDISQMPYRPLRFAQEDIDLIQAGLREHSEGSTSAVSPATPAVLQ